MLRRFNQIWGQINLYRRTFLLIVMASIVHAGCISTLALLITKTVVQTFQSENKVISNILTEFRQTDDIFVFVFLVLVLLILKSVSQFLRSYWTSRLSFDVGKSLRRKILNFILFSPFNQVQEIPLGDFLNRFSKDVNTVQGLLSFGLIGIIQSTITAFLLVSLALYQSPWLALICMISIPFLMVFWKRLISKSSEQFRTYLNFEGEIASIAGETKTLLPTVKIFQKENFFQKRFNSKYLQGRKIFIKAILFQSLLPVIIQIAYVIVFISILMISVKLDLIKTYSISEVVTLLIILGFVYRPLQNLSSSFERLNQGLLALERVQSISRIGSEIHETNKQKSKWSRFYLKNVNLNLGSASILNKIDLELLRGESVAFIGANGAGKTSLLYLLSGLFEQSNGTIEVHFENESFLRPSELSSLFCWVGQENQLFHGTIEENIRFENSTLEKNQKQRIQESLESVLLDFEKREGEISLLISEGGFNLSKGEKRKIAIARALYHNRSILILDEPTSGLDAKSKKQFLQMIQKVKKDYNCTLWIATHDETVSKHLDRVITIDHGKIVRDERV